jgi:stearoyl-CoA desaturase (delta-9 desaturase)
LYPKSARSGFLPYQLDLAWVYIKFLYLIGGVSSYNDGKKDFYNRYYKPFHSKSGSILLEEEKYTI